MLKPERSTPKRQLPAVTTAASELKRQLETFILTSSLSNGVNSSKTLVLDDLIPLVSNSECKVMQQIQPISV